MGIDCTYLVFLKNKLLELVKPYLINHFYYKFDLT